MISVSLFNSFYVFPVFCRFVRRSVRPKEDIVKLLDEELIPCFDGEGGDDNLGVPLFNQDFFHHLDNFKKHLDCIQDPPGCVMYQETGE